MGVYTLQWASLLWPRTEVCCSLNAKWSWINMSRVFAVASVSEHCLLPLPSFRVYAEKPSDALWLPPVSLCTVATPVFRGTDASWDGSISAEQLHGWLWTAGRTIWPPRCELSNCLLVVILEERALFSLEIMSWCCKKINCKMAFRGGICKA